MYSFLILRTLILLLVAKNSKDFTFVNTLFLAKYARRVTPPHEWATQCCGTEPFISIILLINAGISSFIASFSPKFEYVLIEGINDKEADAHRLAKLLKGVPCKVNLIPFNSFESSEYQPPPEKQTLKFQDYLISQNFSTFIRQNRATDILGACGQLATESKKQSYV